MSRNKQRKLPAGHKTRGPGKIQRAESGGAVKGRIPKAGASNSTNFETGISVTKYRKQTIEEKSGG